MTYAGVCHRTIQGTVQAKNVPERQWVLGIGGRIPVEFSDHELTQDMELLDGLPGGQAALRGYGPVQPGGPIPKRFDLLSVGAQEEWQHSQKLLGEFVHDQLDFGGITPGPTGSNLVDPHLSQIWRPVLQPITQVPARRVSTAAGGGGPSSLRSLRLNDGGILHVDFYGGVDSNGPSDSEWPFNVQSYDGG